MSYILGILIPTILIAYGVALHRIIGKNRDADKLLWAFGAVAIIGVVIHMIIFSLVTRAGFTEFCDITSRVLFSLQYSLEMFIGNTIIFKGEVMAALKDYPILFFIYTPIYGMAVITSCFAIFHFLSRWMHNLSWLRKHSSDAQSKVTHIFIGCNAASQTLANDINEKHPEQVIIFIDLPDGEEKLQGISVLDIISKFFKDSKETKGLDKFIVLKAGKGMDKLMPWFENQNNKVYILSDSQESNMNILEELWENNDKVRCKIFCHAKREGLVNRYAIIPDKDSRINFVDSSFLAVEYLKKHNTGELLPVNFVDIAKKEGSDAHLGYVTSGFNCAIIGFGETGKEALKFLYEFGAFPNKEKGKAPFNCHIYDNNIDRVAGAVGLDLDSLHSPETKHKEFTLHQCEIGTSFFISDLRNIIKDLNYIVVCLGNDKFNFETALNIAELATIEGREKDKKLCIAVKMSAISSIDSDTLENANNIFGHCLHTFGTLADIWQNDIISNEKMDNEARKFFDTYNALALKLNEANGYPVESWEERERKFHSENYKERSESRRKIMQDYSNCLHKTTKQILCKGYDINAEDILPVNDDKVHCTGENGKIFEYLAVCEHLRWEASHLVLGYKAADRTDDIQKLHKCIKPYEELSETVKHFDWLVVKNSLDTDLIA